MSQSLRKSLVKPITNEKMDIKNVLKEVTDNFQAMLSEKFDEQNKHLSQMMQRIEVLENANVENKTNFQAVSERVSKTECFLDNAGNDLDYLYGKMLTTEKIQRSKTIVITGIVGKKDEDLTEIIQKIAIAMKKAVNSYDIDDIYRIHSKDNKPRIIVKFVRAIVKEEFIQGIKKKKSLYTKEIDAAETEDVQIYINEYLSQFNNGMWKEAKKLRSTNKVKYAWVRDGEVFVRQTEGGKRIHVNNANIIQKLNEKQPELDGENF